jgi:glycosyltransferase involved in cell wall biosynthesis
MPKKQKTKNNKYPLVSLCTPTYNRRPFIPYMIRCFEIQTYPKDRIEWIIIDDGTDPIGDLVKHIPQVKYFYYKDKMVLGKKRNKMHSECSGDIIIYMDDDDYYPPERISHAVEMLQQNPKILIAGSSEMHIYSALRNKIFQCGPYRENHATAATFAFKRQLLSQTRFNEDAEFAEEKKFLKDYELPLIQLDTLKTILVCSHPHNSLNKEKLLDNPAQAKITDSKYHIDDFIKEPDLKQFYIYDMNTILEGYEIGKVEYKPTLLKALKEVEKKREQDAQDRMKKVETQNQILQNLQSSKVFEEVKNLYNIEINKKNKEIDELKNQLNILNRQLDDKNTINVELLKKISILKNENEILKNNYIIVENT